MANDPYGADKAILDEYEHMAKERRQLEVENADLKRCIERVKDRCDDLLTEYPINRNYHYVAQDVLRIIEEEGL